jgi:hypothetical protein
MFLKLIKDAILTSWKNRPAQIAEAADAYCRLAETHLGLTEAIDFAIRHAYPSAGTLSIYDPIEAARNPRKATEIYLGQRTM